MIQDRLLQFFKWEHLTSDEAKFVSKALAEMAQIIVDRVPANPERTVALRKLLEAKDAAVRATFYVEPRMEQ